MVNSRSLSDLLPEVRKAANTFIAECSSCGIDLVVTSTYRDIEAQNALYAQGRTKSGNIVTNAKGGQSWHNWKRAFDIVPIRNGKPVWGLTGNGIDANPADDDTDYKELWQLIVRIAEQCGLESGSKWGDWPHFQKTDGLKLKDMK